jgi:hypothetical protein
MIVRYVDTDQWFDPLVQCYSSRSAQTIPLVGWDADRPAGFER